MATSAQPLLEPFGTTEAILRRRPMPAAGTRRRAAVLIADAAAVLLALVAAKLSTGLADSPQGLGLAGEVLAGALAAVLWIAAVRVLVQPSDRPLDAFPQLLQAAALYVFGLYALLTLTGAFGQRLDAAVVVAGVLATATAGLRAAGHRAAAAAGHERAIIVGGDEVGCSLAHRAAAGHLDLDIVGIIDERPPVAQDAPAWLGGLEGLQEIVAEHDVDRVIIAFTDGEHPGLADAVAAVRARGVRVDIVPRLHEILPAGATAHLGGVPVIGTQAPTLSAWARGGKRALDLVGAGLLLLVLSPVLLAIAVAIRLDTRGPVLFRQERMGRDGRTFRVAKFRSMSTDAEARKHEVAHLNRHAERGHSDVMFKVADDPRVTRVGSFLRRTSLDELPQLLNVMSGEMSLVGPRPLILEEDAHVTGRARRRCDLRPGITGLWQVSGRSDLSFTEMLALDEQYVTGWSLWHDVKLLLRTVPVAFLRRGAY